MSYKDFFSKFAYAAHMDQMKNFERLKLSIFKAGKENLSIICLKRVQLKAIFVFCIKCP